MSTTSLPVDVRNQLRKLYEQNNLTKMLLSAIGEEYSEYHQYLNLLRVNAASSENVTHKARLMQDARRAYVKYQDHLASILKQAETINHE